MIQERTDNSLSAPRARKWEFLWLCGLILSFAYELPIWYLTSYDRVNPRFFDLMFVLGILIILPNLRKNIHVPPLFKIWAAIVAVFCFCALVWTIGILPWEYGKFSLFFAAKYLEGLIVIYMAVRISLDARQKRIIQSLIVCGGVVVALYSISQYGNSATSWAISGGKTVSSYEGAIFGPLSRSYFHVGLFSVLSFAMTLALVPAIRNIWRSIFGIGLALFVAWPALACGSRAAIAGIAVVLLLSLLLRPILIWKCLAIVILAACFIYLADIKVKSIDKEEMSLGFRRLEGLSDSQFSVLNRLTISYSTDQYMFGGRTVPFIGAGFYVAPVQEGTDSLRYRVGYGIHNSYLFAYEQGGALAFILFLFFLALAIHYLNRVRASRLSVDRYFALGMSAYMAFMLLNAFAGQAFWRGANTANFNTYVVLLLMIATKNATALNTQALYQDYIPSKAISRKYIKGNRESGAACGVSLKKRSI